MISLRNLEKWFETQDSPKLTYDDNRWFAQIVVIRDSPNVNNEWYPLGKPYTKTMSGKTIKESIHNLRMLVDIEYRKQQIALGEKW